MADAKLSELTAATSAAASDAFYLVQSGASKQITVEDLFADVATPVSFSDTVSITDSNTQTSVGEITVATNITLINNVDSSGNCSIGTGVDGQIKIIIMTSNSGGHVVTLNGANIGQDISFDAAGESATLLYTNSKWYFIGGSATAS